MTGWLLFALLAGVAALLLWRMRVPRALASVVGAALMLGAIGYAMQGAPGLSGSPTAVQRVERRPVDPALKELRADMFGRFNLEESYFIAADALLDAGNPSAAARVALGGVHKAPQSAALWTWLGVMLVENDGGTISPAARLAFEQANRLAPQHPGPPYFYGLALARAGNLRGARAVWLQALAAAPRAAGYRRDIAYRLMLLDQLLAMEGRAGK